METMTQESAVLAKTRELCQAILEQPELQVHRQSITTFMADDRSRSLYDSLVEKGQALHQKQHMSVPITDEEIADFEKHKASVLNNPVTRRFLDAQEEMHHVQESIQNYVSKTFELGHIPSEDELSNGGCGHGCGCHH